MREGIKALTIDSPITIEGNVDKDSMQQLRKHSKTLANDIGEMFAKSGYHKNFGVSILKP